jgi:hypothetical protein
VSFTTQSVTAQTTPTSHAGHQRGLTLRSFLIAVFALLLMGMWIEYEELYCLYGGPLAENAPPNSAIGVLLIVIGISALLYLFRKSLRITSAELVVVLASLLVAAPLMTQGMWHRVFGLLAAIPHNEDFKSYESLPSILWPHGPNMVNGTFDGKLGDFTIAGGDEKAILSWSKESWRGRKAPWACPTLKNTAPTGQCTLSVAIPKDKAHLVSSENLLISALVKAQGFQAGSNYTMSLQADENAPTTLVVGTADTTKSASLPQAFMRIGKCPVSVPRDLQDKLTLIFTLTGPGTLTVQDVQVFNSQAVEGLYTGRRLIRASHVSRLSTNDWDFTVIRPDNLFSLAGLNYLIHGFIPFKQWWQPILAWTTLLLALFAGFFGFNVIMRKQWADNERFTFPMNLLPRNLLAEETDAQGRPYLAIFRNRALWIGFGITLAYALYKGLRFYIPSLPESPIPDLWSSTGRLDVLVTHPLLKVYLQNVSLTLSLSLLAIALLVETDILFSIFITFLLFQFMYMFGKAFNWNHYAGYPWDWSQSVGSFIMYAFLALIAARKHLGKVVMHLFTKRKMDDSGEVVSYRTAAWLIFLSLLVMMSWGIWTHMRWDAALIFFGYMLVMGLTASKIRAEAGMPFGYWMPYYGMILVSALGGFATFGTTGMLVATIASGFMCVSCFFFIAPVQVEMMELGRHFNVRPRDVGSGLFLGLLGGILIGGFVLLCWAYGFGGDNLATGWPYGQNWYFSGYRQGEMAADRALGALHDPATAAFSIKNVDFKGVSIGMIVTTLLAALRALFVWFPLHPLGYVLATTHFARMTWFTCCVAWAVRSLVQRIGGAHSIRKGLIPFCVGMFVACVVSIFVFDVVGIVLRHMGVTNIYCKLP